MGKIRAKSDVFRYKGVFAIIFVFALIAVILLIELSGIRTRYVQTALELFTEDQIVTKEQSYTAADKNTLLLYHSYDKSSQETYEQFDIILKDMKIGADRIDLADSVVPEFDTYSLIILLFSDLSLVGESLVEICEWVYAGGNAFLPLTLDKNVYSSAIENKIGIEASYENSCVESIYINEDFMVGGGQAFPVVDAYESARTVQLNKNTTTVHVSIGQKGGVPLIWEADYGEGKFVVNNMGMCEKVYRGFYAASLSLFEPVFVYPVINGSAFYLDDFPSQIPEGNSEYISRDFKTTIRDFYINIWWPDMMNLSDKYNLKYTGLAIESYDDLVDGTTDAEPDTATFLTLGNMILRKGGELGYHGYNHQPLCLSNSDYKGIYDYKTWESKEAMIKSFQHLVDFCEELFADVKMSVYVPPSNLLSLEGKHMLIENFKSIKTLSGIYLPDDSLDFSLLQEFEVEENGIVSQPRIISGCDVDDHMRIGALSELNFHYVNNHFTHPDDALDPERGAELGWKEMAKRFEEYLHWLYTAAPGLRNFTGSELSAAIQRFVAVTPHIITNEDSMEIWLEYFQDNAQLMLRFNEEKPNQVTGGTLTHLTGDLYLLDATNDTVTITFQ